MNRVSSPVGFLLLVDFTSFVSSDSDVAPSVAAFSLRLRLGEPFAA